MQVHRIQNNNCNTTSFRAKLPLDFVKGNKTRWKTIASEFECMTKKYPNYKYSFIPDGSLSKGLYLHLRINEQWSTATTVLEPKMTKLMGKMSDTEIADKLKKLFELWVELKNIKQQSDDIKCKLFFNNNYNDDALLKINVLNYAFSVNTGLHNRAMSKLIKDPFFEKMINAIKFSY